MKTMAISYKKLWHFLIDKEMNKTALQRKAGITWSAISKLSKGENVNTEVLIKICDALQCELADIVELEHESK